MTAGNETLNEIADDKQRLLSGVASISCLATLNYAGNENDNDDDVRFFFSCPDKQISRFLHCSYRRAAYLYITQ